MTGEESTHAEIWHPQKQARSEDPDTAYARRTSRCTKCMPQATYRAHHTHRPKEANQLPLVSVRPTQHPPPPYAYLNNVSIPVFHHWPLSSICLVDPKHVEQVMVVSPPQPGHGMGLPSGPMDVRPMQKVHLVRPVPLQ